ncbi:hypothetical protein SAMN04515674_108189 [Pseudarcicella hirudinis]|uniref:Uncharacterized protein n=1 Tax=Pseudarcicella hirudinis TaxID=1079859 RepID=A0A1I5V3Z9_9BACT|nr:hypothetical protein [Pseudarcicella hirudinis]SFQ02233.1 hypothetical protein SAMN04515674_108189 [Pseudarcicella hirudinis]
MKTFLLILIILSSQLICFSQQSFDVLSKKVYRYQKFKDKSTFHVAELFFDARKSLTRMISAELKQPIDTLYLVEAYDIQSGEIVATIWCSLWRYNYRYGRNKIKILDYDNFSKELYNQTMLGNAKITLKKDFGTIAGLATKVCSQKKDFNIISHSFEE